MAHTDDAVRSASKYCKDMSVVSISFSCANIFLNGPFPVTVLQSPFVQMRVRWPDV